MDWVQEYQWLEHRHLEMGCQWCCCHWLHSLSHQIRYLHKLDPFWICICCYCTPQQLNLKPPISWFIFYLSFLPVMTFYYSFFNFLQIILLIHLVWSTHKNQVEYRCHVYPRPCCSFWSLTFHRDRIPAILEESPSYDLYRLMMLELGSYYNPHNHLHHYFQCQKYY